MEENKKSAAALRVVINAQMERIWQPERLPYNWWTP